MEVRFRRVGFIIDSWSLSSPSPSEPGVSSLRSFVSLAINSSVFLSSFSSSSTETWSNMNEILKNYFRRY